MNNLPFGAGILSRTDKGQTDGHRNLVKFRRLLEFCERPKENNIHAIRLWGA